MGSFIAEGGGGVMSVEDARREGDPIGSEGGEDCRWGERDGREE